MNLLTTKYHGLVCIQYSPISQKIKIKTVTKPRQLNQLFQYENIVTICLTTFGIDNRNRKIKTAASLFDLMAKNYAFIVIW